MFKSEVDTVYCNRLNEAHESAQGRFRMSQRFHFISLVSPKSSTRIRSSPGVCVHLEIKLADFGVAIPLEGALNVAGTVWRVKVEDGDDLPPTRANCFGLKVDCQLHSSQDACEVDVDGCFPLISRLLGGSC